MMLSHRPRVSVIIPTYNSAAFLGQAVASVLEQTYADFELIVVDDGSTDDTRHVLTPYFNTLRYIYQDNAGESAARNTGIQEAQGEYIAFLDADDLWLPNKLAIQVASMDQNPAAVLTYGRCFLINAAGERTIHHGSKVVGTGKPGVHHCFPQLVMEDLIASPSSVLARRSYLIEGRAFDPAIRHGEDWDLWLRLSLQGPFHFSAEPLACYRIHHPKRRLSIEAAPEYVLENLRIVELAFIAAASIHPEWCSLRGQAVGALFLRSAIYNLELGNHQLASEQFEQAIAADPEIVGTASVLPWRIAHEACRIAEETNSLALGRTFIEAAFDCLPSTVERKPTLWVETLAEFHATAAFMKYYHNQRQAVWHNAALAVWFQPTRLRNRGLISVAVRSALGMKPNLTS